MLAYLIIKKEKKKVLKSFIYNRLVTVEFICANNYENLLIWKGSAFEEDESSSLRCYMSKIPSLSILTTVH